MDSNQLRERTKLFAYGCIDLTLNFPETTLARHVKSQLIRAATSVAANYRAACRAQTKAAFISKISIPIEESDECQFWLTLAVDKLLTTKEAAEGLVKEPSELLAIFISSRKTAQVNLNLSKTN